MKCGELGSWGTEEDVSHSFLCVCVREAKGVFNSRAIQDASREACGSRQERFWMLVFVSD